MTTDTSAVQPAFDPRQRIDQEPDVTSKTAAATPETEEVSVSVMNVKNLSLAVMATLVSIAALRLGAGIFVPLMMSVVLSYALTPVVDQFVRWHVPRSLSAAIVVFGLCGALGWMGYRYADDARALIDSLPGAAEKLALSMSSGTSGPNEPSALEKVEIAAEKLQNATAVDKGAAASLTPASGALSTTTTTTTTTTTKAAVAATQAASAPAGPVRVQVERPRFSIKDYLWTGTMGLISGLGQLLVVIVLTFFLLSAGNTFRRKMLRLAGPTLSEKKETIEAMDQVSDQIQRYLLVMVLLSILTGIVTSLAFWALGMNNPIAWGALAAVFNLIPYLGAILVAGGSMLGAFLQFGTIEMAFLIGFVGIAIHTVIGQFLTPWLTGKASHMNSVTVFIGVLAWGWVWGLWGLFLAVPILVIVKVVSERIDDLKPIAEFLGD
ncbi:MAG: AI-2E family transporter [Burkholderiaceae bacterium]